MHEQDEPQHATEAAQAAQDALERACVAYLHTHTEVPQAPMVLDGFVIMIQGREMSLDGVNRATVIWATPDRQSVSTTLGLTSMLEKNVDLWFRSGETRED